MTRFVTFVITQKVTGPTTNPLKFSSPSGALLKSMALYKRKEFAEKCGVKKAYLTTYIGRGKVILTGKMIDDSIPENAYFMKVRTDKIAVEGEKGEPKGPKKPSKILTEAEVQDTEGSKAEESMKDEEEKRNMYNLGLEKKKLDIEKVKEDIEIAKLKREKLSGELIPTDLVKIIFATHSKSITTGFHQGVENILSQIAKQAGLDREQIAKIRGNLIDIINKGIKTAGTTSRKDLANVVAEYSQKRERGEKE